MSNEGLAAFRESHRLIELGNGRYYCSCGAPGVFTTDYFVQHVITEWMRGFNPGMIEEYRMPNPDIATYTCPTCGTKKQIEFDRIRSEPPPEEIICALGHDPVMALRD